MATIKRNSMLYYGPNASTYEQALMVSTNTTCTVLWQENGYYYVEIPSKGYRLYTDKDNITGAPASVQVRNVALQRRYVVSETADCRQGPGTSYASMPRPQYPFSVMYASPVKENNYALIEYTPKGFSKKARAWFNANGLAESPRYPGKYTHGNSINAEGDSWYVSNGWASNRINNGHLGIDVYRVNSSGGMATYKNVYTIADGIVEASSDNTGSDNGKCVIIRHTTSSGKSYYSTYCHLNSRAVSSGASVKAGQAIGVMGETGNAAGVHVHIHITRDNAGLRAYGYYRNTAGVSTSFSRNYVDMAYNSATGSPIRYYNPTAYFAQGDSLISNNY